jgi:hypothetical protein
LQGEFGQTVFPAAIVNVPEVLHGLAWTFSIAVDERPAADQIRGSGASFAFGPGCPSP